MTDKALARVDTGTILLSSDMDEMMTKAKLLLSSGLLPESITKPEQAIVIMLKGQELGIPPMEALSSINVIKGKPSLSASLQAALVERAYGPQALIVGESTNEHCIVSVWKPGWEKRRTVEFSMEDAKRAQINSHMYQKYPRAMLRSRAISAACETYFQAVVGGVYTPEELGDEPASDDLEAEMTVVQPPDGGLLPTHSSRGKPLVIRSDGRVMELDEDTGEITDVEQDVIDGDYSEVEDDVPFQTPEEMGEEVETITREVTPPGIDSEFLQLLRALNKWRPNTPLQSDDPVFAGQSLVVKKRYLINETRKQIITTIGKARNTKDRSAIQLLDDMKANWGDHPAWDDDLDLRWEARRREFAEVEVPA